MSLLLATSLLLRLAALAWSSARLVRRPGASAAAVTALAALLAGQLVGEILARIEEPVRWVGADPLAEGLGLLAGLALVTWLATSRRSGASEGAHAAHELLAETLQVAPVLAAAFDEDGRVVYWNRECERVTGYGRHELPDGKVGLLGSDEHARRELEEQWTSRSPRETQAQWEVVTHGEETRVVLWTNLSERRPVPGWAAWGVGLDVTESAAARARCEVLEAELQHARKVEAVGTLAGGVAHDINNLLTAIFGYTGLAREALDPDHEAQGSLDMVEESSRRAMDVTKALLAFSRRTSVRRETLDVVPLIRECLRLLRRLLPATIRVAEHLPAGAELWVRADSVQVQQVLMNLAVAARDAMPLGGELDVALSLQGGPQSTEVMLEVNYAPDPASSAPLSEPDLGAVHSIVEEHKGRFLREPLAGGGFRHEIRLPKAHPPAQPKERSGAAEPSGPAVTILLAGDDPYVRSLTLDAMRSAGYRVLSCVDGPSANAAFEEHREEVDLVVTDYDLPGHNGIEVLRRMRELVPDLHGIVATGLPDIDVPEEDVERTLLLHKPFPMSTLIELIERQLARGRSAEPAAALPDEAEAPSEASGATQL